MILVVAALLAVLVVPVTGGDLRRMGALPLRQLWLVWAALGLQTLLVSSPWKLPERPSEVLHLASYVAAGVFAVMNWRIPGVPLIAAGGAMNLAAIAANGGVMPASASALRRAGLDAESGFSNSAHVEGARLAWLGDVFAVPATWPLSNVFSIGDIVLVLGIGYLAWRQCRTTDAASAAA